MSNTFPPYWVPSQINAEFLNKGSEAMAIGDLLYWDTVNNCVRSVSNFADQGSAGAQQAALAPLFVGVANSACQSTDATTRQQRILVDGIYEMPCDSGTFAIGDYVSISYSAGARNQQVAGVGASPTLAIGRVVKRYSSATTFVKCRLMSRYLNGFIGPSGQDNYGLTPIGTLAATGTNAATAAQIVAAKTQVTGSDGTKGVILPVAIPGMVVELFNAVASTNNVYPGTGIAINALSTGAVLAVPASKNVRLIATSATQWFSIAGA